jgi:S1-C subfamily serine protease
VNRVIEHTVETVAPKGQAASTVVTQEKTVVVKETDLISQAVDKVSPSIVRLYTDASDSPAFLGLGVVLDTQGTIVTDSAALGDSADATLALPDGSRVRAFVTRRDADNGFAFLSATTTPGVTPTWTPATISSDHAVLGETVVEISGKSIARIASGIVTSMPALSVIDTDVSADSILDGSPLINTNGDIVGISTTASRDVSPTGFVTAALLIPAPPVQK